MRKTVLTFALLAFSSILFSLPYTVKDVNITTENCGIKLLGKTQTRAVSQNVPFDTNKTFSSDEELYDYIEDYKQRLNNTRAFESILVDYKIENDEVTVNVELKDSIHFLAVPYPKYNSNTGGEFKLKMKDTNFLGSLNEMSTELRFSFLNKDADADGLDLHPDYQIGFAFSFDKPFFMDPLVLTWVNDYDISYIFGEKLPEWNAKTGLSLELPADRISFVWEFYQYAINDFDYTDYDDAIYFTEEAKFSTPITLYETKHWGDLTYTPYAAIQINWDKNGINKENSSLSSPVLSIGHFLEAGRVNWANNFRNGYTATISNSFTYNFQRKMLYPSLSLETMYFTPFEFAERPVFSRMGIAADFYFCMDFVNFIYPENPFFKNDGTSIGARLRGIRDEQEYDDASFGKAALTPSAFVLNLDFPFHIFTTNFSKGFLRHFNFDLQLSPFIDTALTYNKQTNRWFSPKDGFYAAGIEALVYPHKWSSFTVRASVGVDIGRMLLKDVLDTSWRKDVSMYEVSFGVGLHY